MFEIIAHRGLWGDSGEKNSASALYKGFQSGFGVETDLRDAAGALVIAHDPVGHQQAILLVDNMFAAYRRIDTNTTLALNIKADGLREFLHPLLLKYGVHNYFCFDMSVPETLAYHDEGFRFFTRESEFEPTPVLYSSAAGVWMDMFEKDWVTPSDIEKHFRAGKQVALVSPDLHGRPPYAWWSTLRDAGLSRAAGLMLCTDHPIAAREFFHGHD